MRTFPLLFFGNRRGIPFFDKKLVFDIMATKLAERWDIKKLIEKK